MEYPSLDKSTAGAFRFNTDSSQLEIYDGNQWTSLKAGLTPELQTSGCRGLFAGGFNPSMQDVIDYVNVSTTGNAIDFGNLLNAQYHVSGASSRTRGLFHGFQGDPNTRDNVIEYVTISSTGNAIDFGDLPANITSHSSGSGVSNSIRAVRCAGYVSPTGTNRIDYVTIATTGNASDFGDVTVARYSGSGFSDSHGGLSE